MKVKSQNLRGKRCRDDCDAGTIPFSVSRNDGTCGPPRATLDAPLLSAQTVVREHFTLHLTHHLFDGAGDALLPRVFAIP